MVKEGFNIDLDKIPGNEDLLVDDKSKKETPGDNPPRKEEGDKGAKPREDNLLIVDVHKEEEPEKEEEVIVEGDEDGEKKKEEIDDKSKKGEDADASKETESPSFLHATALRDKGILPNLDLETLKDKDDEAVLDATLWATQEEIDLGVQSIVDQYDASYQEFIKLVNSGADLNEYARIKASQKRFDGLEDTALEENVDLQKQIVAEDMKDRGLDNDDISDTIADYEEKEGRLFSKAKLAKGRINKRDVTREKKVATDAEAQKGEAKKEQKAVMDRIDASLEKVKEIIPGIPVSKNEKVVVKNLMTVPVRHDQGVPVSRAQEMREKDPVAWEQKLAYYVAIGLFDDTPKWDKVLKRANSDAAKKLMGKLKETAQPVVGKAPQRKAKDDEGPMQMPFSNE